MKQEDFDKLTFSNPRKSAIIENWPKGFREKCTATFTVECDQKKGERLKREITGKPVYSRWNKSITLVDGSDGKTYFFEHSYSGGISVMQGDMKYSAGYVSEYTPERHAALLTLITEPLTI